MYIQSRFQDLGGTWLLPAIFSLRNTNFSITSNSIGQTNTTYRWFSIFFTWKEKTLVSTVLKEENTKKARTMKGGRLFLSPVYEPTAWDLNFLPSHFIFVVEIIYSLMNSTNRYNFVTTVFSTKSGGLDRKIPLSFRKEAMWFHTLTTHTHKKQ